MMGESSYELHNVASDVAYQQMYAASGLFIFLKILSFFYTSIFFCYGFVP
jgi:hypothetical protein